MQMGGFHTYLNACGYSADFQDVLQQSHWDATILVVTIPAFIVAFFGNLLLLVILIKKGWIKQRTFFIVSNMTFIDFLVSLLVLLPDIYYAIRKEYFLGELGCILFGTANTLNFNGTPSLMVLLATERYIAIVRTFDHKIWLRKRNLVIAMGVLYLYLLILIVITERDTDLVNGVCMLGMAPIPQKEFHLISSFFIPAIIITILYSIIWRTFTKTDNSSSTDIEKEPQTNYYDRKRPSMSAILFQKTLVRNQKKTESAVYLNGGLRRHGKAPIPRIRMKMIKVFTISVIIFYITYLPYTVITIWRLIAEKSLLCIFPADNSLLMRFLPLSYMIFAYNSALNPLIYFTLSTRIRKEVQKMFRIGESRA